MRDGGDAFFLRLQLPASVSQIMIHEPTENARKSELLVSRLVQHCSCIGMWEPQLLKREFRKRLIQTASGRCADVYAMELGLRRYGSIMTVGRKRLRRVLYRVGNLARGVNVEDL